MSRTVLVVDDEPLRLSLTIAMIEECGCIGVGASNGERAQYMIAERGQEIGVVLTDVRMPGSID